MYGDSLVIGNLQMPDLSDTGIEEAATMFGGRYKNAGNKPVPKLKAMKTETAPRADRAPPVNDNSYTPPPIGTGSAYGPPGVVAPPGAYLMLQPGSASSTPPYGVLATSVGPPVYDLPLPNPPVIERPKREKKGRKTPGVLLNVYSSEPTVRMQQLHYQSEDLRQLHNEWRRFWFNDQPSHLTRERIHGGIY